MLLRYLMVKLKMLRGRLLCVLDQIPFSFSSECVSREVIVECVSRELLPDMVSFGRDVLCCLIRQLLVPL